jgi:hypothetical protein
MVAKSEPAIGVMADQTIVATQKRFLNIQTYKLIVHRKSSFCSDALNQKSPDLLV